MLELQARKRKSNKAFYSLLVTVILLVVFLILIKPTYNIWQKKTVSNKNLEEANKRLVELEERESVLSAELERLGSKIGQEEEIVRKFDVVREGEELAVILEPEENEKIQKEDKGFWSKLFSKYFGWLN